MCTLNHPESILLTVPFIGHFHSESPLPSLVILAPGTRQKVDLPAICTLQPPKEDHILSFLIRFDLVQVIISKCGRFTFKINGKSSLIFVDFAANQ
jgi:hypothetical protein